MSLEKFYENWSHKTNKLISYDISAAFRKTRRIMNVINKVSFQNSFKTIIDFGCGYGTILYELDKNLKLKNGYGFDFSNDAVNYATKKYKKKNLIFYKFQTLNTKLNTDFIKSVLDKRDKVDCILLIDLLEHVPNCNELIRELSKITKLFIVKLPIESSILYHYFLRSTLPGPNHPSGHLREFDVIDVHYFIRKLGLIPLIEETYIYDKIDLVPPQESESTLKLLKYSTLRIFSFIMSKLLPKNIFLKVVGGGGYICIAKYDENYLLDP